MNNVYTPGTPTEILENPVRSLADWNAMREACENDLGAFHATIAESAIHWYDGDSQSWLSKQEKTTWRGWHASSGARVDAVSWQPWQQALDESDAPFYRWFVGGLTNAAFNEVDRHVLAGHGGEIAFHYEGDRWDPALNNGRGGPVYSSSLTRRELMIQSVFAAQALRDVGLSRGDRIAINMPNILEQVVWTQAAKRLGIIYTPVFGGFSDKTLSDRIENAGARVVITADGASRNAEIVSFKESYTDPALDQYISVASAQAVLASANIDDSLRRQILERVGGALVGEITVTRADVMREAGHVLARAGQASECIAESRALLAEALSNAPSRVDHVIVIKHVDLADIAWREERDVWAHELLATAEKRVLEAANITDRSQLEQLSDTDLVTALWKSVKPVPLPADFPLFIIYTSGSTGKPKGVVHVHGGYTAGISHTMKVSFDARPGIDVIWVVADPGWITGQSYLISAALTNRITSIITEGAPVFPNSGRFASIIERYGVTIFKAGVTFLKGIMSNPQNRKDVERLDMSSLKVATFCAEPISPTVQRFAMDLVTPQYTNSYWATEHGGIVWTHPYGNPDMPLRADAHTYPLPWIFGDIWISQGEADEHGRYAYHQAEANEKGEIVITRPFPYLARTIWGDPDNVNSKSWKGDIERFTDTYYGRYRMADGQPVYSYLQGDFARKYADGSFSLHGRSDDVINVSGHRIGTEEIEGAILKDKQINPESKVGNCIVVGAPHRDKGLTPLAFIQPLPGQRLSIDDERRLAVLVQTEKGALAVPSSFITVRAFPETRSGKYMRRYLKAMVLDADLGDTSTLRNPECLEEIRTAVNLWRAREDLAGHQVMVETTRTLRIEYAPVGKRDNQYMRIATITIDNPPVNALSERLLDELETVLTHIHRRTDIGAVVIAGHGSDTFVAGADVRQLLEDVHDEKSARAMPSKAHNVTRLIETMDKPVIAAIEGVALGGGCELAMACHWRIGNQHTCLGQPEINLFLPPGYGGTQRLTRIMADAARPDDETNGLGQAFALLLSGRDIKGTQARENGLLNDLCQGAESIVGRARAAAREAALSCSGPAVDAMNARHAALERWQQPSQFPLQSLQDSYVQSCLKAAKKVGRGPVAKDIIALVRCGWATGFDSGLAREAETFARYVLDDMHGGKRGIQLFMDKCSPPLPSRERVAVGKKATLIERGELLPMHAPFYAGVTPIPRFQLAQAVIRDETTGAYLHGDPIQAETEVIMPVPEPGVNQALVYVLASEVNYNDIWAITGIPVSLFDEHDEDVHVTGSGGVGIIAALGEGLQGEGRLALGQIVTIYSGVSDLLDPAAAGDPMFTDFHIQGYQSPDGSHQQFMLADGPQLIEPAANLNLETMGSYLLPAGTAYRSLFRALNIRQGDRMLVEGAASGTGAWCVELGMAAGAKVTGMVSSGERENRLRAEGAHSVNRREQGIANSFTRIPEDPGCWEQWLRDGDRFLAAVRRGNDGKLCTHGVSHAGETAFPRTFQALQDGGVLTYFGASSGYYMTFMGKPGSAAPSEMLRRTHATPGQSAVIFYGHTDGQRDSDALAAIEAARASSLRIVVITDTDSQRDFVLSLGYGNAVAGAASLEEIKRREPQFEWPDTMPELPAPESEKFKEAVRMMNEHTLKPIGRAIGKWLRSADNPAGQPDVIVERAHRDSLFVSVMMVKPHTGAVLYSGDMGGRRYSFYAPQVWMRQRSILMPSASILGTHLCNAGEVVKLNRMISSGAVTVPEPYLGNWDEIAQLHQAMWENRLPEATGGAAKAAINHALPRMGLMSLDELLAAWSEGDSEL